MGYTGGEERVRGIAEKCRPCLFRNPCWKGVAIYEFPIYELAFGCLADNCTASGIPFFHDL